MHSPYSTLKLFFKITLLVAFLLLTVACSTKPHSVKDTDVVHNKAEVIYVVSHGWHTSFVIPAETIHSRLPGLALRFPNAQYLEFGWGDTGFYQAEEITSGLTLRAILWPTDTVVHVVALQNSPDLVFSASTVVTLCVTPEQFSPLLVFIENSFKKSGEGKIISLKKGIYGNSQFYHGVGGYHLFNTCNNWTAKGLKSAGADIQPALKLTAESVMNELSRKNLGIALGSCKDATMSNDL